MAVDARYFNLTSDGYIDYTYMQVMEDPPVFSHYDFEVYDWKALLSYMQRNTIIPILAVASYLVVIFGLEKFMKNREPFQLKKLLFVWNAALGLMSIVGFWRVAPEFIWTLWTYGFYSSVCIRNGGNQSTAFWLKVFMFSKFWELGDTVFIVLRKKPLTFLQWGHHALTLSLCWITCPFVEPIGRYYSVMNYGVHSLMYPYFALRALDIKVPRKLANLITTLQLAQMVIGLVVNTFSGVVYQLGMPCARHPKGIKLYTAVYGLFIYLFGKLYYDLVVSRNALKKNKSQ